MADVAEMANVSIATVSRVLNSPDKVARATRDRVIHAVRALDFVVHPDARGRARKSSGRIGLLTPFLSEESFVHRVRGVAAAVSRAERELVVYSVESVEQRDHLLEMLPRTQELDGLIVISLHIPDATAAWLRNADLPIVCIEHVQPGFAGVRIDNIEAGKTAARYLVSRGYRRIAYVGETGEPAYSLHPGEQRLVGFLEGLEEAGLDLPDERLLMRPFSRDTVGETAQRLLSLPQRPDAIFASSDLQAIYLMKELRSHGVRIPQDVALMGFDNIDFAVYLDLTTVDQRLEESGHVAVELLRSVGKNHEHKPRVIELPLAIEERSTT